MAIEGLLEIATALSLSWLRLGAALLLSIAMSLLVGIPSGLSRGVERLVLPILDVLQSVPILGFFPIAVYFFISINPILGPDLASIFLIFTSTFWNMAFGVYEGVRAIPPELYEISRIVNLGISKRLRQIIIPASIPRIISQLPPSIANGLYFLTASEIISFGEKEISVAGVGSLVATYVRKNDVTGIVITVGSLALSIALIFTLIVNPLITWAEKFRFETVTTPSRPGRVTLGPVRRIFTTVRTRIPSMRMQLTLPSVFVHVGHMPRHLSRFIFIMAISAAAIFFLTVSSSYISDVPRILMGIWLMINEMGYILVLNSVGMSFVRIAIAIFLSLLWSIPVAYIVAKSDRLRRTALPVIQIIASMPVPIFFPLIADAFLSSREFIELGSILLIVLGTQWYIFYSLVGGFLRIPTEYRELSKSYSLGRLRELFIIYIPFAMPSLVTGLITATGGAWNTLVVAERLVIGGRVFETSLPGLGKLLSQYTEMGSVYGMAVIVFVMTVIVVAFNRFIWRPLYDRTIKMVRE
ncbi:MAG: ABC transporter permease subunit [Nitrososphaerota archaeon]